MMTGWAIQTGAYIYVKNKHTEANQRTKCDDVVTRVYRLLDEHFLSSNRIIFDE
jgi:hypothetical protein